MDTLTTAQSWRNLGIATIPIRARDKRPALESWRRYQTEMPTLRDLEIWFSSGRYNLAVITGHRGLVVIDFDDIWAYSCWVASASARNNIYSIFSTYRVQTRRGWHLYVYCREATSSMPGDGWDIKAAGGYVLAPPSTHPSGHVYVGVGRPEQIVTIASVWDVLPRPAEHVVSARISAADPFDDAMRDSGDSGTTIEAIKARHSLHGALAIPANGRRHMMRCPLPGHADNHESFAVYPDGHYHCFGCGRRGDIIDYHAATNGITIAEAMRGMA